MTGTPSTSKGRVRPKRIMFRSQLTHPNRSSLDSHFLCHRQTLTLRDSRPRSCPQSYFKGKILVRTHATEGHKEELVVPTCGMRRRIQSRAGCSGASVTHIRRLCLQMGTSPWPPPSPLLPAGGAPPSPDQIPGTHGDAYVFITVYT